MRFQHLQTFVETVERGSLSEAARALGISQPAVTNQLKRIESELGATLLIRGERGVVSLTAAGQTFLRYARQALAEHEAMRQRIAGLREEIGGDLSLAASTTPGEFVLPQLLSAFKARYPRVEARVTIADTMEVVDKVLAHECDVGFIGAPVQRPHLTLVPFVKDRIVLAVYPEHPFAGRDAVRIEELRGQPLILREEGSGTLRSLEQALREQGAELPRDSVALTLGSTHSVVSAVQGKLGIGFASVHAMALYGPDQVRAVPIEGLSLSRDLYIAYDEGRISTPLLREFLAFARTWAGRHQ